MKNLIATLCLVAATAGAAQAQTTVKLGHIDRQAALAGFSVARSVAAIRPLLGARERH